jgi:hypothetical protein
LKFGLLCEDLLANPCRKMLAGGLCPPLSKHFKRKMLWSSLRLRLSLTTEQVRLRGALASFAKVLYAFSHPAECPPSLPNPWRFTLETPALRRAKSPQGNNPALP